MERALDLGPEVASVAKRISEKLGFGLDPNNSS
jgi:hypothetical protein